MTTERTVQPANELVLRDPAPVVVERIGTRAVVTLFGDLDLMVEDELIQTISDAAGLRGLSSLHVDATKVAFIDSSGLRSLVLSRQAVLDRGLGYTLAVSGDGPVARLLVLTGLHGVLADELVTRSPVFDA
jgi:anti-anti-sigma factor